MSTNLSLAFRFALLLGSLVALGGGCDPGQGTYTPGPGPFGFKSATVTTNRAQLNQSITVKWDYNSPGELKTQEIHIWTHSWGQPSPAVTVLAKTARQFTFTFTNPVTVNLFATANNGKATDVAFDVLFKSDYYFRMRNIGMSEPTRPQLGATAPQSGSGLNSVIKEIQFSRFDAIYDKNGDGIINDFAAPPLNATFVDNQEFAFHSVNFVESAVELSNGQKMGFLQSVAGNNFPLLQPRFFLTNEGIPVYGKKTRADAVVIGIGLAYDGVDFKVTDDKGKPVPGHRDVARFDPMFACVHVVLGTTPVVAEIDVGNINQGLVLSVYRPVDPYGLNSAGKWSLSYNGLPSAGVSKVMSGAMCGGLASWLVTTYEGNALSNPAGYFPGLPTGSIPGVWAKLGALPGPGKPCADGIDFSLPFVCDTDLM